MRNDYLRDRAMRRDSRRGRRDMRNPYGSRGGYVRDSRGRRDRADMDYRYGRDRNDYTEHYDRYDSRYDRYDGYDERDYRDYEYDRYDSRYDRDYAVDEMEKEYMHELNEWIAKLKKKDRYKLSEPEVMKKAKDMGVKFDNFDEKEFYAVYLMMVSDFKAIGNDPHIYLAMAKDWLMDDDIAKRGSEKVCAYLYTIVLGDEM